MSGEDAARRELAEVIPRPKRREQFMLGRVKTLVPFTVQLQGTAIVVNPDGSLSISGSSPISVTKWTDATFQVNDEVILARLPGTNAWACIGGGSAAGGGCGDLSAFNPVDKSFHQHTTLQALFGTDGFFEYDVPGVRGTCFSDLHLLLTPTVENPVGIDAGQSFYYQRLQAWDLNGFFLLNAEVQVNTFQFLGSRIGQTVALDLPGAFLVVPPGGAFTRDISTGIGGGIEDAIVEMDYTATEFDWV